MNITGTEDNPKIKVGKDNKGNELVGTKDDTDDNGGYRSCLL